MIAHGVVLAVVLAALGFAFMVASTDGADQRAVGPDYSGERRVLWLRDPFE